MTDRSQRAEDLLRGCRVGVAAPADVVASVRQALVVVGPAEPAGRDEHKEQAE
jgi:hypothetical protein